ncbi:Dehydrogenase/reductase SDR family member on chromosome X [Trachymyrmex zeteki]|uniref:Dehydrogenase/reductase SDR family member on chromosome X n=1 Tax=Mycetomoellerius zeteki TaxID=64791 RepID=A0A151WJT6_9HYME|nr:Dehydrogenase/reductase SDR family member on chromosome X [Trachymyrmex zeteki]
MKQNFLYYIIIMFVLFCSYSFLDLLPKPNRIAIVTGGSRGIGAEVVKQLLQCDMEVIIACRVISAGENIILQIRESGVTSGRAKVYKLDNSSLESVKKFAKQIKADYDKIHILINNAAVMFPTTRKKTEDGYEKQWMVNYLSHFLLTSLLLPVLKTGGRPEECSRIVNVTSCAHDVGTINFDYINNFNKEIVCRHTLYGQSKLAQTMSTITLQKLFKDRSLNILVYAVHPGIVKTDLFKETILAWNKWIMTGWKTAHQGAIPVTYATISKDIERKGGVYISNCKEMTVPSLALEEEVRERLFELSLKQIHLENFFQYL